LHGDVVPGRAAAEEAHGATVDRLFRVEGGRPVHLTAKAELGIFIGARNARLGLAQARQNFLGVVADRWDDAHPGDDDPSHASLVRISMGRASAPAAANPRSAASLRGGTDRP